MTNTNVKAVTFDLWDTLFIDDTDEPKRKAQGLLPKPETRKQLLHQFVNEVSSVSRETIDTAYDMTNAAFRHVWYEQNVTWTVGERLSVTLKGLGCQLSEQRFDELVKVHEEMELEVSPDMIPGAAEAIQSLSKKYKLAIISDTIFSPGRVLRKLLEAQNILTCFSGFIFSDEIASCKPNPVVFEAAAQSLGVNVKEIVHIGDREQKDIVGPHGVGAKGVLCTASIDRDSQNTKADAVFNDYSKLESIIEKLY